MLPCLFLKRIWKPGHCGTRLNHSSQEAETGGSLSVQGQPDLRSEFPASQGCKVQLLSQKKKNSNNNLGTFTYKG